MAYCPPFYPYRGVNPYIPEPEIKDKTQNEKNESQSNSNLKQGFKKSTNSVGRLESLS